MEQLNLNEPKYRTEQEKIDKLISLLQYNEINLTHDLRVIQLEALNGFIKIAYENQSEDANEECSLCSDFSEQTISSPEATIPEASCLTVNEANTDETKLKKQLLRIQRENCGLKYSISQYIEKHLSKLKDFRKSSEELNEKSKRDSVELLKFIESRFADVKQDLDKSIMAQEAECQKNIKFLEQRKIVFEGMIKNEYEPMIENYVKVVDCLASFDNSKEKRIVCPLCKNRQPSVKKFVSHVDMMHDL